MSHLPITSERGRGNQDARERLREFLRAPQLPVDLDALAWNDLFPGVRIHVLEAIDGLPKRALVVIDPRAEVPEHTHEISEDVLMLEGSLEVVGDGDGRYAQGEIFRSPRGTTHSARNAAEVPCLCYVVYWPPIGDQAAG